MKDYNEMAKAVFERRDEYLVAQKKKKALFFKACIPVCSLVLVTMMGLVLWQAKMPELPVKDPKPTTQQEASEPENTENITDSERTSCNGEHHNVPENTDSEEITNSDGGSNIPQNTKPQQNKPNQDSTSMGDAPATNGGSSSNAVKPGVNDVPNATAGADEGESPVLPTIEGEDPAAPPTMPVCTEAPAWTEDWGEIEVPATTAQPTWVPEVPYPPLPNDSPDHTIPPATEEATGPLEIVLEGNTYTAEKGDKVTFTAELWIEKKIEDIQAQLNFTQKKLEMIVPAGFENSDYSRMVPNMRTADVKYNDKTVKVTAIDLTGRKIDFREEKVFMTVEFMVTGSGKAELDLRLLSASDGNKNYVYAGKPVVTGGITLSQSLTITPADEVVPEEEITTKPAPEETDAPPFEYPEESTEGDLLIHCDSRTYAANIGQKITYVMELEADEKFVDFQATFGYEKGVLKLIIPEDDEENDIYKEDITAPYISNGIMINYTAESKLFHGIKFNGVNTKGYDFRKRKIFVQFDFIVESAGEIDLDMIIEEMSIDDDRYYFTKSEASVTEGIQIYEYIIVH